MDSHPKKKKKKKLQSKSEIKPRSRRWQRSIQSILYTKQKQTKPHYPTLQYRGVYQKKKKRNQIQSKKETKYRANQTPNPEQTKPTVAPPLLAGAARSVTSIARRPCLVVVARSPVVVARRFPAAVACPSSQIANRSHRLSCSGARPVGLKVFLSFSL